MLVGSQACFSILLGLPYNWAILGSQVGFFVVTLAFHFFGPKVGMKLRVSPYLGFKKRFTVAVKFCVFLCWGLFFLGIIKGSLEFRNSNFRLY